MTRAEGKGAPAIPGHVLRTCLWCTGPTQRSPCTGPKGPRPPEALSLEACPWQTSWRRRRDEAAEACTHRPHEATARPHGWSGEGRAGAWCPDLTQNLLATILPMARGSQALCVPPAPKATWGGLGLGGQCPTPPRVVWLRAMLLSLPPRWRAPISCSIPEGCLSSPAFLPTLRAAARSLPSLARPLLIQMPLSQTQGLGDSQHGAFGLGERSLTGSQPQSCAGWIPAQGWVSWDRPLPCGQPVSPPAPPPLHIHHQCSLRSRGKEQCPHQPGHDWDSGRASRVGGRARRSPGEADATPTLISIQRMVPVRLGGRGAPRGC